MNIMLMSGMMCLFGGAEGIAVGYWRCRAVAQRGRMDDRVRADVGRYSVAFATAVGILFCVWPARRVSSLDPIEALRYE